jgi:hypothetical protein
LIPAVSDAHTGHTQHIKIIAEILIKSKVLACFKIPATLHERTMHSATIPIPNLDHHEKAGGIQFNPKIFSFSILSILDK